MNVEDRKLLLLGLLRIQAMHGYQLNQFLDEHLDFIASLKPSTAYYTLERMAAEGLVQTHAEQPGRRPARQIYDITPAGEALYQELLKQNLSGYAMGESGDDIGIGFLADLPPAEAERCLALKRAILQEKIVQFEEMAGRITLSDATHLAVRRTLHRLRADEVWLEEAGQWLARAALTDG
ncbi:MAG: helix-turn-helix transcriptional regulator [Caldilineaceae bacterium]|nr:helix-turn-helix transcriptional regulator [Caldilineaceae bacterium]